MRGSLDRRASLNSLQVGVFRVIFFLLLESPRFIGIVVNLLELNIRVRDGIWNS
jgi:hypothetical protein